MDLEMHIRDDKKLVEIWLNSEEKRDTQLRERLKDVYAQFKAQKYLVAVYESGEGDLYQGTLDLLRYNKRRSAEREVQKAKRPRVADRER